MVSDLESTSYFYVDGALNAQTHPPDSRGILLPLLPVEILSTTRGRGGECGGARNARAHGHRSAGGIWEKASVNGLEGGWSDCVRGGADLDRSTN